MAVQLSQGYRVVAGSTFVATLSVPPGLTAALGARVEAPVSRAVVSAFTLATVDVSDPLNPIATVLLDSPLLTGFFNLVWRTNDPEPPEFETFVPIEAVTTLTDLITEAEWPDVDVDAVRPAVADVARLERTRTIDSSGNDVGTFAPDTRPTNFEVEDLIDQATDDVLSELRPQFDPARYRQVKRVITFYAAALVESSYYREQQDRTVPYEDRYREALAALQARIAEDIAVNTRTLMMEPRGPGGRVLV